MSLITIGLDERPGFGSGVFSFAARIAPQNRLKPADFVERYSARPKRKAFHVNAIR